VLVLLGGAKALHRLFKIKDGIVFIKERLGDLNTRITGNSNSLLCEIRVHSSHQQVDEEEPHLIGLVAAYDPRKFIDWTHSTNWPRFLSTSPIDP
jgi:hypothetical protein